MAGASPDKSGVVFTARNGTRFFVADGAVQMAQTTNSFFRLQDPDLIPAFRGPSRMTDGEVIFESRKLLEKLSGGRFTAYGSPALEKPKGEIPFVRVKWRDSQERLSEAASIEFDTGRRRVVYLHLSSAAFNREDVASEMRGYVKPEKKQQKRPLGGLPVSEENAARIYRDFERLSAALGASRPATMSPQSVDWNASFHITNSPNFPEGTAGRILFDDKGLIDFAEDRVIGFAFGTSKGADHGGFISHADDLRRFGGKIEHSWEPLAKKIEERLEKNLGFSKELLSGYKPVPARSPPSKGSVAMTQFAVHWAKKGAVGELAEFGWSCELDLGSGELLAIHFSSPAIRRELLRWE